MANLYLYQQTDMSNPSVWYGYVSSYSSSHISLTDYGSYSATYYGSFSYSAYGLSGGTVTRYKQWFDGSLSYEVNGASVSAVTLNNYLDSGNAAAVQSYVLSGNDYILGSAYSDYIKGYAGSDTIYGNQGNDTLDGGTGNDRLDGGQGADLLIGGAGGDTYIVDDAGDVIQETSSLSSEIDTIRSSIDFSLADDTNGNQLQYVENLILTDGAVEGTGNALKNKITGNALGNTLDGGAGVDSLIGGAGDDTYIVDLTAAGALQDTITETGTDMGDTLELRGISTNTAAVTLTLAATLEHLDASGTGTSKLNLTGNTAANTLTGNDAGNILNGMAGADTLIGGNGNDTYVVDNTGDLVAEDADEGTDLVNVTIATVGGTYALSDNVENATLLNAVAFGLVGNDLDNTLIGNTYANTLVGSLGNDTLDGKAGADTLLGGLGDDVYYVDNKGDVVTEATDEGADEIRSTISFDLSSKGLNIENLTLLGAGIINATGNALDNELTGNSAANILDGGLGADLMDGGKGNDTYVVDDAGDDVIETYTAAQGGGLDTVKSSLSYTLGENLDNLILTGEDHIDGMGNALNNVLMGNGGNNALNGGAGIDTLKGGQGNDTYVVDLVRSGTTATVKLEDTVTENAGQGDDTIVLRLREDLDYGFASSVTTLTAGANVENLYADWTEDLKLNLTGNAGTNMLIGNDADNVLDGMGGADILYGGAGDDTYVVDHRVDSVVEVEGEGTDTVQVKIDLANGSYNLGNNLENATLLNAVNFGLVGNDLDNTLIGNAYANTLVGSLGNDTLDGKAGADTLIGGAGNDIYVIDNIGDIVTELGDGVMEDAADKIRASISIDLSLAKYDGVEQVELTGTTTINATGDAGDNQLTGNSAANILDGKGGADTLIGGAGGDTYIVDDAGDVIQETSSLSSEIDTIRSSIDFSLADTTDGNQLQYVENLILTDGAVNGIGNALKNKITGNALGNTLDGGAGVDNLIGGAGDDTYIVDLTAAGALQDTITETGTDMGDTLELRGISTNTAAVTLTLATTLEHLDASGTGTSKLNLTGNTAANTLTGNDADNVLKGLAGDDTIYGGGGNDTLDGGAGTDNLSGGDGDDTYLLDQLTELDNLSELVGEGIDTLFLDFSNSDTSAVDIDLSDLDTHPQLANFENLTLKGTGLFNLVGNDDANILIGNTSINELEGNDGNDLLKGGLGNDILTGGAGSDIFRFDTALNASTNVDLIEDFVSLEDLIQLENGIFTKLTALGELSEANFRPSTTGTAQDANDFILYNTNTGALYYDADGSGGAAAVQFATLIGQPTLTHTDFIIT